MSHAEVFLRVIPEAFRGPGFEVIRNNVYELVRNADGETVRRLVTQLEETGRLRVPIEQLPRLLGSSQALGAASMLAKAGSVASVATLAVVVVGFAAVGKALHGMNQRLQRLQEGQAAMARDVAGIREALDLLDMKVDHLAVMADAQLAQLQRVEYRLMLEDEAQIEQALQDLQMFVGSGSEASRLDDARHAARVLHKHRIKVRRQLAGCPSDDVLQTADLVAALALLAAAESNARFVLGDPDRSIDVLDEVVEAIREVLRERLTRAEDRWSVDALLAPASAVGSVRRWARMRVWTGLAMDVDVEADRLVAEALSGARTRTRSASTALNAAREEVEVSVQGLREAQDYWSSHAFGYLDTRSAAENRAEETLRRVGDQRERLEGLRGALEAPLEAGGYDDPDEGLVVALTNLMACAERLEATRTTRRLARELDGHFALPDHGASNPSLAWLSIEVREAVAA